MNLAFIMGYFAGIATATGVWVMWQLWRIWRQK